MPSFTSRALVLYCGILMSITAVSIDITLAAFSLISLDLNAAYSSVQMIIPVFIIAVGFGQIVMGPLSDRFGRKPIIMMGLLVYLIGAVICLFAPSIEILLFGRAFQGIGAAVGPVLSRAVLRDTFSGQELARNMALATMLFAVGPIVAPLLGAAILQLGSWRYIFLVVVAFILVVLLIGVWFLKETNLNKDDKALSIAKIRQNFQIAFENSQTRFFILMAGPIMMNILLILICLPRIYKDVYNIEGSLFSVIFAFHGIGIIVGQAINRRMITKIGTASAMCVGAAVIFGTTLLMYVLYSTNLLGPYVMAGVMALFATGYLVVLSNATALALDPVGQIAGFASSIFGFSAQFISSIAAASLALWVGGDLPSFIIVMLMLTGGLLAILSFWNWKQKGSFARG
jgi:DHA1 family bicyclomycin/chloramphenicol resistance-like MFS transporter